MYIFSETSHQFQIFISLILKRILITGSEIHNYIN